MLFALFNNAICNYYYPTFIPLKQQQQLITQPSQGKTDTNLLENIFHTHIHTHTITMCDIHFIMNKLCFICLINFYTLFFYIFFRAII